LIAIWFPVQKIRILFTVKSIVVPIAAIVFCIWTLVKAKGFGPILHQPGTLTGRYIANFTLYVDVHLFFR
jgi:NCS1 family nucleobase:cation symporter-1